MKKLFSCESVYDGQKVHTIITLFGIKFKFRNKSEELSILLKNQSKINFELFNITLKDCLSHKNTIFHLSAFSPVTNVGDNLLVSALQTSINNRINTNFINKDCRNLLTDKDIYLFNNSQGVIIGGGGLFLKDTNYNTISGWQVPISVEQINRINVPIALMGVGYNRFRNQEDFDECFYDNIKTLISKCVFAGIRNTGSIEVLKKYLPEHLHRKLKFHPCATTILDKIYPAPAEIIHDKIIVINCAFDRMNLRYGGKQDKVIRSIANVVNTLLSKDYKIKYYVFHHLDYEAVKYLEKNNINMDIVDLRHGLTPREIIYANKVPDLFIGMRGHAQLIPFGCGTPILSIISHDKLKWFLEDINHPEWGVDVSDDNFEEKLYETACYILTNKEKVKKEIRFEQQKLYDITLKNLEYLFDNHFNF